MVLRDALRRRGADARGVRGVERGVERRAAAAILAAPPPAAASALRALPDDLLELVLAYLRPEHVPPPKKRAAPAAVAKRAAPTKPRRSSAAPAPRRQGSRRLAPLRAAATAVQAAGRLAAPTPSTTRLPSQASPRLPPTKSARRKS